MAVTLRLARHGQTRRPFYRLVAADKEARRDGRYLEVLGVYNPMTEPPTVSLKEDKIKKWLGNGAQVSQLVRDIIRKQLPGVIEAREEHKTKKIRTARRQRKERAKKRA